MAVVARIFLNTMKNSLFLLMSDSRQKRRPRLDEERKKGVDW
jgi:hypothetical protein